MAVRYVPDWIPGAGFKKLAKEWNATIQELAEKPMRFVKQEMDAKRNEPSFVSNTYDKSKNEMSDNEKHILKWAAAALYTGGADTVSITDVIGCAHLLTFISLSARCQHSSWR